MTKSSALFEKESDRMSSWAEKFFSERELAVVSGDHVDPGDLNARDWFNAVDQAIAGLPKYQHDNMGVSDTKHPGGEGAGSSSSETETGVWFFRGHKDSGYAFNSTLYRQLINDPEGGLFDKAPKDLETAMCNAELKLLEKSREIGIGRGLTALESLTLLQHHGSPTRLIDITSDWKVALFFACEGDDSKDGRVFLVKIAPQRWADFPRNKQRNLELSEPVWRNYWDSFPKDSGMDGNYSWLSGTWPILLPFSDPRMISQRGFFLVGGVPSLKGKGNLYTSQCNSCHEKICTCGQELYGTINSPLDREELRQITSLAIRFGADRKQIKNLSRVEFRNWTAVGYSIRVPKKFKPDLREILCEEEVHTSSLYPPLRDTVLLFEHVVAESFKSKTNPA